MRNGEGRGEHWRADIAGSDGPVPDPRSGHGRRHPLGAILGLAICAMLCGSRSLYAISQWGRDQGLEVSGALGFTRDRTPCVSTLHQCSAGLDREAFELLLEQWLGERGLEAGEALAIDGKRLRGIHGEQLPGVHLVAAYAHQSGIVLGQQAVRTRRMNWRLSTNFWPVWT